MSAPGLESARTAGGLQDSHSRTVKRLAVDKIAHMTSKAGMAVDWQISLGRFIFDQQSLGVFDATQHRRLP